MGMELRVTQKPVPVTEAGHARGTFPSDASHADVLDWNNQHLQTHYSNAS